MGESNGQGCGPACGSDDERGVRLQRVGSLLLRWAAFLCLGGWAWAHLYWEFSYGGLLWSEGVFSFAERLGVNWDRFVGDGETPGLIQGVNRMVGWGFLLCAVWVPWVDARSKWTPLWVFAASGALVLMSLAKYVGAQGQLPMFVEHGGQMLTPLALFLCLRFGASSPITVAFGVVAVLATFAGHGAYAIGFWPTPANYYGMTTAIFHWSESGTTFFLRSVGLLDYLVCVGLFVPRLRRASVLYAVVWGALTALARPVAGMSADLRFGGADQYLHECFLRAPHFLLPMYLYFVWGAGKGDSVSSVLDETVETGGSNASPTPRA